MELAGYSKLKSNQIQNADVYVNGNKYTIKSEILVGFQGHVYVVEKNGKEYILKIMRKDKDSTHRIIEQNILLYLLKCKDVIKMIEFEKVIGDEIKYLMIFPYAKGGDMQTFLKEKRNETKSEHELY